MPRQYDLKQLSELANLPQRKVRYYIQNGLVDSHLGGRRNASYTDKHLEQLLTIQHWQKAGLSLDKIKAILNQSVEDALPPEPAQEPGDIQVVNRILISNGVNLEVDMLKSKLNNQQLRVIAKSVMELVEELEGQE